MAKSGTASSVKGRDDSRSSGTRAKLVDAAIEQLRAQLSSGAWQVGDRIPTEHELAEQLQV